MTGRELQEFLWDQGVMPAEGMLIADAAYSLPDASWIEQQFAGAFGRLVEQIGMKWQLNRSDCDKFARLAAAHAGIIHAQTGHRDTGLAFGEFWYCPGNGDSKHAINAAVVKAEKLQLLFWEPQTQRTVRLSKAEVDSCSGVRF